MIGNRYAAELVSLLESKNVPAYQALQNTGLQWERIQSGAQTVRKHHMQTMIKSAEKLVNEADLGLQFGRRLNANTHGILGYALMSAGTLREMIMIWLKYYKLNYSDLALNFVVEDGSATLTAAIQSEENSAQIFAKEALFASIHTTTSFLLTEPLSNFELWFDYPVPGHAQSYVETFGIEPKFNMSMCSLRFPTELLDKRLPSANPEAAHIYKQQCDNMLRSLKQRQGIARQVQQALIERNGGFPRIAEVANQLHMSERTLRRKLDAEGTSFQEILNDVRYKIAAQYLSATSLTVADIADLLGFADPSNFRRAFIQWAGISPAAYRREQNAL